MQFTQFCKDARGLNEAGAAAIEVVRAAFPHLLEDAIVRSQAFSALLTKHAGGNYQEHAPRQEVHGRAGRDDCAFWRNKVPRLHNAR